MTGWVGVWVCGQKLDLRMILWQTLTLNDTSRARRYLRILYKVGRSGNELAALTDVKAN